MRVTMQVRPGGAWEATNVTLESMIRLAYRIQESQIVGGPAWIYNDRFDIVAKSPQGALGAGVRASHAVAAGRAIQFDASP